MWLFSLFHFFLQTPTGFYVPLNTSCICVLESNFSSLKTAGHCHMRLCFLVYLSNIEGRWQGWKSATTASATTITTAVSSTTTLRQLFYCWDCYHLKPVASQHSLLKWQNPQPLFSLSPSSPLPLPQSIPTFILPSFPLLIPHYGTFAPMMKHITLTNSSPCIFAHAWYRL